MLAATSSEKYDGTCSRRTSLLLFNTSGEKTNRDFMRVWSRCLNGTVMPEKKHIEHYGKCTDP